ncbi:hypothetical protein [Candidatus Contubernalis alkaliaceticus]|uniref:hypothetical protein n=1 Tax=Candidatus Contubernalis alkaliaceticus TaxID=338645 RepID=UPI001F4BD63B|nr:hypothetical protein [Candidatus Contubernalis alkalaceticus]UNC92411.1 hypothetical protein HUE98_10050 [Candidatus Contubernalis alkalaceticus]
MINFSYSLIERSPGYGERLKQVEKLEAEIVALVEELDALKPKINELEDESVDAEISSIWDPRHKRKAEAAGKELAAAKDKLKTLTAKKNKYEMVFARVKPEMEIERQQAIEIAKNDSRKDHENAVKRIVQAMRELSKAFQEERVVREAVRDDIGVTGHILPPSPVNDPGSESDVNSNLSIAIREWKQFGYKI